MAKKGTIEHAQWLEKYHQALEKRKAEGKGYCPSNKKGGPGYEAWKAKWEATMAKKAPAPVVEATVEQSA